MLVLVVDRQVLALLTVRLGRSVAASAMLRAAYTLVGLVVCKVVRWTVVLALFAVRVAQTFALRSVYAVSCAGPAALMALSAERFAYCG